MKQVSDFTARPGPFDRVALAPPIETMRAIATILLVSYHVIGSGPAAGLHVDYPDPLRLFAEFFKDLRMPMFAFIAGYVFALKPVRRGTYPAFIAGKIRRLLVPGLVAALAFAAVRAGLYPARSMSLPDLLVLPFFPYAHFWFLQAIFAIFVVYALLEALVSPHLDIAVLALSMLAYVAGARIDTAFFSLDHVAYLLPSFMLGVVVQRHLRLLERWQGPLIGACAAALCLSIAANLMHYETHGVFSPVRDPQSLIFAFSACLLLYLFVPNVPALGSFGAYSFTIYLYHVFGTAAARDAALALGETRQSVIFVVGLAAGIGLPVALHRLAARSALTRCLVLGARPSP